MGIITRARAKAILALWAKGSEVDNQEIPKNIPVKWEQFSGTKDLWCKLDMPLSENTTACLYKAQAGSTFPPHFHKGVLEHFTILNKSGKVKSVTYNEIKEFTFPNSVTYKPNEIHAVKFLTETTILVMWHPRMDEFDINIVKEQDINLTPAT